MKKVLSQKVFLFLRNRELSVKGFLLDGTSLLHLCCLQWGWKTMMIGKMCLLKKAKRYSFRIVLTWVIHIADSGHLYG